MVLIDLMKKLLEKLIMIVPYKWVMSFFDTIESITGISSDPHRQEERKGWDTRIKLSESDVNKIMTTDEFKDLVESQDYETNNSVLVIGDILKDMDIPFTFDQVILD
jgi:hypothetical protein